MPTSPVRPLELERLRNVLDDAAVRRQAFFATVRTELVYARAWHSRHELELEAFSYAEGFYDPRRQHTVWETSAPTPPRRSVDRPDGHRGIRSYRIGEVRQPIRMTSF